MALALVQGRHHRHGHRRAGRALALRARASPPAGRDVRNARAGHRDRRPPRRRHPRRGQPGARPIAAPAARLDRGRPHPARHRDLDPGVRHAEHPQAQGARLPRRRSGRLLGGAGGGEVDRRHHPLRHREGGRRRRRRRGRHPHRRVRHAREPAHQGRSDRSAPLSRGGARDRRRQAAGPAPGSRAGADLPGPERDARLAARAPAAPERPPADAGAATAALRPAVGPGGAAVRAGVAAAARVAPAVEGRAPVAGVHPLLSPRRQPAAQPHVPAPRGIREADGVPPPLPSAPVAGAGRAARRPRGERRSRGRGDLRRRLSRQRVGDRVPALLRHPRLLLRLDRTRPGRQPLRARSAARLRGRAAADGGRPARDRRRGLRGGVARPPSRGLRHARRGEGRARAEREPAAHRRGHGLRAGALLVPQGATGHEHHPRLFRRREPALPPSLGNPAGLLDLAALLDGYTGLRQCLRGNAWGFKTSALAPCGPVAVASRELAAESGR
jgi:hypothetical protein